MADSVNHFMQYAVTQIDAHMAGKPAGLSANRLRLSGEVNKAAGYWQRVYLKGTAGDRFTVGGWSCTNARARGTRPQGHGMRVVFCNSLTGTTGTAAAHEVRWSEAWGTWQYAATQVEAPIAYQSILVYVDYADNLNTAEFGGRACTRKPSASATRTTASTTY